MAIVLGEAEWTIRDYVLYSWGGSENIGAVILVNLLVKKITSEI